MIRVNVEVKCKPNDVKFRLSGNNPRPGVIKWMKDGHLRSTDKKVALVSRDTCLEEVNIR